VEETGVPGENHQPVASHWQIFTTLCDSDLWHVSGFLQELQFPPSIKLTAMI